jgi:hypothetical protein
MSNRILVSTRKGLFTLTKASGKWQLAGSPAFLGDNVTNALFDARDGTLYAALNLGHFGVKLRRSSDQGKTWEEVGVPSYAEFGPAAEGQSAPTLALIWILESGGPNEKGVLWAGTAPGGLFKSTDRGQTWIICRPLWEHPERGKWFGGGLDKPAIHSVCIHPKDARHITLGISCGGVWQTADGGLSWHCRATGMFAEYMPPEQANDPNIQDPHRVVQCSAAPDVLYAQHHNGVFKSSDGAKSWQEIKDLKPSKFGFAVCVHPEDPNTAWLVPAVKDECRVPVEGKMVVNRTYDGGKTWETLRAGLPQENCYDLVFRHALDVDATGNRLVMGSTTGGLWISENQGDTWTLFSAHLPPVHAVRWVA